MRNLLIAAAVTAGMAMSPAGAVLIDFANEADTNGERGINSGDVLTIDGIMIEFSTMNEIDHPYFDAGNAGLGVCMELTNTFQCDPPSDDNVTSGEDVGLLFVEDLFNITQLVFRDAQHNLINAGNDGQVTIYTGVDMLSALSNPMTALFSVFMAMAAGNDPFFQSVGFIAFEYVDTEFYVSGVGAEVPLPGALPLLLSGLAGLGFASRRKKKVA